MINRFKKNQAKKKWEEDIEEVENLADVLKEYKPSD